MLTPQYLPATLGTDRYKKAQERLHHNGADALNFHVTKNVVSMALQLLDSLSFFFFCQEVVCHFKDNGGKEDKGDKVRNSH